VLARFALTALTAVVQMREIAQSERRTRRLVEKLPQPLDLGPVLSVVDPTLFQPVLAQICEFVTSLAQPLVLGLELLNPATLAFSAFAALPVFTHRLCPPVFSEMENLDCR
jgi:hypothetical protein